MPGISKTAIGIPFRRGGVIPFSYEPELLTYIDGLETELSDGQLTLLNNFILTLKAGLSITNLSDAFDVMYILAGETAESSLRNLIRRAHDATNVNATPHVAYEGFTGDAISMYLDSNYSPATDSMRYSLNSASFGLYSRTSRAYSSTKCSGCYSANRLRIYPKNTSTKARGIINNIIAVNIAVSDTLGMTSVIRLGATSAYSARNKTLSDEETTASAAIPEAGRVFLLATAGATSVPQAGSFDDIQIAFAYLGRGLVQAELNVLFDAFETLMDANGKGVIP